MRPGSAHPCKLIKWTRMRHAANFESAKQPCKETPAFFRLFRGNWDEGTSPSILATRNLINFRLATDFLIFQFRDVENIIRKIIRDKVFICYNIVPAYVFPLNSIALSTTWRTCCSARVADARTPDTSTERQERPESRNQFSRKTFPDCWSVNFSGAIIPRPSPGPDLAD